MARSITNTARGDFTTSATGAIAEILLDIITAAKYRKAKAVATAAKYGVDYENLPGEFIAKEARNKLLKAIPLVGNRLVPKVSDIDDVARGQSSSDPLMGVPVHLRRLPEYQQLASPQEKAFRSRKIGSTSSSTSSSKPVKVKDPSLGVFLSKIADALSGSVASLNTKLDGAETAIVASKEGIGVIAKQLEENADNVETKLDAIIDILRDQMNIAKVQNDNIETKDKLVKQNEEVDQSGTFRFVGLDSTTEKTRQLNLFEESQEQGETTPSSNSPMLPQQLPLDLGEGFERGGIASGPDSGYLAKLHGDEMIIPLDNNYTQGEPSAIDGKVRRPPMFGGIQKFEKGTSSPEMEEFSPNAFAKNIVPIEVGDIEEQTKKLTKATEIPTKAAGIILMGQLQRAIPAMGPLAAQVAPELSKIVNPIASAFGINSNISFSGSSSPAVSISNISADKKVVQEITDAIEEDKDKEEKSWMDRLLDPFRGLFGGGGPYPSGGGPVKYERGTIVMKGGRGSRGMPGGGPGTSGGNPIMNWFNKGANTRIPNESAARFGNPLDYFSKNPDPTTLFGDDALQRGQSDANFAKGKRPSVFGRPDRAILSRDLLDWHSEPSPRNPKGIVRPRYVPASKGGPGSAPTPISRELIKRPIRAGRRAMSGVKPAHPLMMLAEMIIGDLISPQPTAAYDQLYGPNAADPRYRNVTTFEEYSAMQSESSLTPPKLNLPNQVDMQSKDQVFSKISGDVLNLDPIVLNNNQNINSSAPDEVISPISTAGDSDLSTYYPSLSWF